jgi:hypothetical protein
VSGFIELRIHRDATILTTSFVFTEMVLPCQTQRALQRLDCLTS